MLVDLHRISPTRALDLQELVLCAIQTYDLDLDSYAAYNWTTRDVIHIEWMLYKWWYYLAAPLWCRWSSKVPVA